MVKQALLSTAMLAAFFEGDKKDYIDLLTPFVIDLLPKRINQKINIKEITKEMDTRFGFAEITIGVVERILQRCIKEHIGCIKRSYNDYILTKVIENEEFRNNSREIEKSINTVITKLREYINSVKIVGKISERDAEQIFTKFLISHGYQIKDIKNEGAERLIDNKERNNYLVAKFIYEESNKPSGVFQQLEEIQEGFLIYKALYHYCTDCEQVPTDRLRKTFVFFDTGLLLDMLGYTTDTQKQSIKEITRDIVRYGGKVCTFTHNAEETAGALRICAKDQSCLGRFGLESLILKNLSPAMLIFEAGRINELLLKEGVMIIEASEIDCDQRSTEGSQPIDMQWLRNKLDQIGIEVAREHYSNHSINNDADALAAIYRYRRRSREYNLCNCKAILITTNPVARKAARELKREMNRHEREIDFAISDIDIASVLWLKNPRNSNFPRIKLLQNAYSSMKPTRKLIDKYHEKLEELKSLNEITDIDALEYRNDFDMLQTIREEVMNDADALTQDIVRKHVDDKQNALTEAQVELAAKQARIEEMRSIVLGEYENARDVKERDYNRNFQVFSYILKLLILPALMITIMSQVLGSFNIIVFISAVLVSAVSMLINLPGHLDFIKKISEDLAEYLSVKKYRNTIKKLDSKYKIPGSPFFDQ